MLDTQTEPQAVPSAADAKRQLLADGFCTFKNVLDRAMLDELRRVTNSMLDDVPEKERELYRYQGSNIFAAYQHEVFARLFAWPKTLEALAALGFTKPKWLSSYLLSKPPKAPPLYWHQDWWLWDDASSTHVTPPQLFLMYYLTDTRRENGCLRVIPGSHRKRVDLHDQLPTAHTEASYKAPLDSPGFRTHPQERDVQVNAGDLVIGDARVLHAAHGNGSDERRTCLTLWYSGDFDALTEPAKAAMARKEPLAPPHWWPGDAGKVVEPLIPYYSGQAAPAKFNRVPGALLK